MILVVHAHPYPSALARLRRAARRDPRPAASSRCARSTTSIPTSTSIATPSRRALERADLVVWLHPLYWYTAPALMKHWFDEVLVRGWAYGEGGTALAGKDCLWVGDHRRRRGRVSARAAATGMPFEAFVPVVEQTARFCGMNWLEPFVVHGAHEVADEELRAAALRALRGAPRGSAAPMTEALIFLAAAVDLRADRGAPGAGLGAGLPHRRRGDRAVGPRARRRRRGDARRSPSWAWC